jgi:hypothetical protein
METSREDMMDKPTTKAELLERLRRERKRWERLVAEVGEARMAEPGPMGDWTFTDLLTHLTAWQRLDLARLDRALGDGSSAPPWPAGLNPDQDQDRINQFIHEATRHQSPAEALAEARRTWDRLEAGLATLPEEALIDPRHFDWMEGEALGPAVVHDVIAHYHDDHEADVRAWLARRSASEPAAG